MAVALEEAAGHPGDARGRPVRFGGQALEELRGGVAPAGDVVDESGMQVVQHPGAAIALQHGERLQAAVDIALPCLDPGVEQWQQHLVETQIGRASCRESVCQYV